MGHGRFVLLLAVTLFTPACASSVEIITASASGGAGTGGAGEGGAGGAPAEDLPEGHYAQFVVGNCINYEEWLSFGPSNGFAHTIVDRDFCGSLHSVDAFAGTRSTIGEALEITWSPPKLDELRQFTYTYVDPYPYPADPVWPPHESYTLGTGALNTMAYARSGDAPTWHRRDRRFSAPSDGNVFDVTVAIDVALDAPLVTPSGPTACDMKVNISVKVIYGSDPPDLADETFTFPCSYGPAESLPWARVTGNGFEESSHDNSWSDYLTEKGVWGKYSSLVMTPFYDAFRPVLFFDPSNPERLFHDMPFAWFFEMEHPPPTSIE